MHKSTIQYFSSSYPALKSACAVRSLLSNTVCLILGTVNMRNCYNFVIVVSVFGFPCLFTVCLLSFFAVTSAVMNKVEYYINLIIFRRRLEIFLLKEAFAIP